MALTTMCISWCILIAVAITLAAGTFMMPFWSKEWILMSLASPIIPGGMARYRLCKQTSTTWIPGVGWQPGAGDTWGNMTLFDRDGRALPSIKCYEAAEFLRR